MRTKVSQFGAKGDGVTDDTTAIQRAVTAVAAAGGGTVLVESGIFRVSTSIELATGVVIEGNGPSTVFKVAANVASIDDGLFGGYGGADSWRISGVTIDMDNKGGAAIAALGAHHWKVSNCRMINIRDYGVFVNSGTYWTIADSYFEKNVATGVYQNQSIIASSDYQEVSHAQILRNTCIRIGIYFDGHNSTLALNEIIGTGYGSGLAVGAHVHTYQNLILGNKCKSGRGLDFNATIVTGFEIWGPDHIIIGNEADDNDGSGFDIGSKHGIIALNNARGNGRYLLGSGGDGFVVRYGDATYNGNYSNWIANVAYDGGPGTQNYGLHEQSASLTGVNYSSNNFTGNILGDAIYLGSAGVFTPKARREVLTLNFGSTGSGDASWIGGNFFSGASLEAQVQVATPSTFPPGVFMQGRVDAANSVELTLVNHSASAYDPGSIAYNVAVTQY